MHSIASKLSSHRSGVWHKIKDSKTRAFQHRGVWTMVISPFYAAQQQVVIHQRCCNSEAAALIPLELINAVTKS